MSDPFDDRIRSELASSTETSVDSHAVLGGLRPSLRRARRIQQIKGGVVGLAMVAASGGALMVIDIGGNAVEETVIAVSPDEQEVFGPSTTTVGADTSMPTVGSTPSPDTEVPTTDGAAPTASGVVTTVPSEPPNPSSTSASLATTSPSTSQASSSAPSSETTSTTATTGGNIIIDSPCGSIVVSIDGDDVVLVESLPDPGFGVDEKNNGPETVEVSFEGPDGHCEIEAEMRDGLLESEVSAE